MRTSDLLLSSLDITEDEYFYKGQFILSSADKAKHVDIMELERVTDLSELKSFFSLEESSDEIRKILMEMVMEKADIGSIIVEGK